MKYLTVEASRWQKLQNVCGFRYFIQAKDLGLSLFFHLAFFWAQSKAVVDMFYDCVVTVFQKYMSTFIGVSN